MNNWILIIGGRHDGHVHDQNRQPLHGDRLRLANPPEIPRGALLELEGGQLGGAPAGDVLVSSDEYVVAMVRVMSRSFFYASPPGVTEAEAMERLFGHYAGLPQFTPANKGDPRPSRT